MIRDTVQPLIELASMTTAAFTAEVKWTDGKVKGRSAGSRAPRMKNGDRAAVESQPVRCSSLSLEWNRNWLFHSSRVFAFRQSAPALYTKKKRTRNNERFSFPAATSG